MSQSNSNDTDWQALSQQLSCPSGEAGIKVADMMSQGNMGMINSGIHQLQPDDQNVILELGPGNGTHVGNIQALAENLSYVGLDISPLMVHMCQTHNQQLPRVSFYEYDGETLAYPDNSFHRILTVNTLYFFKSPVQMLNELHRVLKLNGRCVLVFAAKAFMETLPFTSFGFSLYSLEDFKNLVAQTAFTLETCIEEQDVVISKSGKEVERLYFVVSLKK